MTVQLPDIEALRDKVSRAMDALRDVEQSDDLAHSNGSHTRALLVLIEATRVLNDALRDDEG